MTATDHDTALATARYLAEMGVPIFLAEPSLDDDGEWNPSGGHHETGYWLPGGWQVTEPDPSVLDNYREGMAVCAVMGHVVDLLDVDPRNGGDESVEQMRAKGLMPTSYGHAETPSGGTHDLIAPLGVRSRDGVFDGVDVKSGAVDGAGRGFAFIAPTRKLNKASGEIGQYHWVEPPDVGMLCIEDDESIRPLAEEIESRRAGLEDGYVYDGSAYEALTDGQQAMADAEVQRRAEIWRIKLDKAADWAEGERDEQGRGWEKLCADAAWAIACLAKSEWNALDEHAAKDLYLSLLPASMQADRKCRGKWSATLVGKAEDTKPPWETTGFGIEAGMDATPPPAKAMVDVANTADAVQWLRTEIGAEGRMLAGMFSRDNSIVHVPRIGESGYEIPSGRDRNGPAQIRRVTNHVQICSSVEFGYQVLKTDRRGQRTAATFPEAAAKRIYWADLSALPNLRPLEGVTHTPIIKADGSVLTTPGYDDDTAVLYLPDPGLVVPEVDRRGLDRARTLIDEMLEGFPFVTTHDRANYIAALLTPIMRNMLPPPYRMVAIGAPQPGSGKSLLGQILRIVHGGVLRSEFPVSKEEQSKQFLAILDTTSAPVVQFDNVTGVLRSSVLDGLLTSDTLSDRVLGKNVQATVRNDRLWVITGNNLIVGGDTVRRTLWVTIDAQMEHPEDRTDFRHPYLAAWVAENRGEILWALLTLVAAWVRSGRRVDGLKTTDHFGQWTQVMQGIIDNAGILGTINHTESVRQAQGADDEEWVDFLAAVEKVFGSDEWTAAEVMRSVSIGQIDDEAVPEQIMEKVHRGQAGAKSLGRWLMNRKDRWAGGRCVHQIPDPKRGSRWVIESRA